MATYIHRFEDSFNSTKTSWPNYPNSGIAMPSTASGSTMARGRTAGAGLVLARIRGAVFGRPLAQEEEIGERLSKKLALPIFSSDAISSSAYASDEIIHVLVLAGLAAFTWSIWVSIAIAVLLTVVAVSYRQVCRAYPTGGGYTTPVTKEGNGTADRYSAIFIGDNAFGHAISLPVELRDGGILDFGREHALAWYAIWGLGVITDQAIVKVYTN